MTCQAELAADGSDEQKSASEEDTFAVNLGIFPALTGGAGLVGIHGCGLESPCVLSGLLGCQGRVLASDLRCRGERGSGRE